MHGAESLERFLLAQARSYDTALQEIRSGRKRSHWMWFVFPQLRGLGRSEAAHYYGLSGREEAAAYLAHPVLGQRLREISGALLEFRENDPRAVLGQPDDLKLRSSMTLFAAVSKEAVFAQVLEKYYGGRGDRQTLAILQEEENTRD